jgi:hypothetical protein
LRVAKSIFEGLPDADGKAFFAALPYAVARDGKDLSRVVWAFLAAELRALPKVTDGLQAVIDPVIAGMDLLANGNEWPEARSAANRAAAIYASAAYAAAHAAYAAANAAADRSADAAANATAYADHAYAAANAATNAAANAARAAVLIRQRDTLLALIAAA